MKMSSDSCQEQQGGLPRWVVAALSVTLAVVLVGGVWFSNAQEQILKHQAEDDLAAIAKFKVEQIKNWRQERLGDASVIMESPFFAQGVERFLKSSTAAGEQDVRQRLLSLKVHNSYRNILLLDANGKARLSLDSDDNAHMAETHILEQARIERRPIFSDIHVDWNGDEPHVSVVAPLFIAHDQTHRLLGGVVLVMPAKQFLYPLLQNWPTHSSTAETLLVRRDGDHALFLNELRHQPETDLPP